MSQTQTVSVPEILWEFDPATGKGQQLYLETRDAFELVRLLFVDLYGKTETGDAALDALVERLDALSKNYSELSSDKLGKNATAADSHKLGGVTAADYLLTKNLSEAIPRASQSEAEAGEDNTHLMTPLRTKEAVAAQFHTLLAGQAYGSVGSFVFAVLYGTGVTAGDTYAGSELRPAGIFHINGVSDNTRVSPISLTVGTGRLSGTWRALGLNVVSSTKNHTRATLFQRIA